MFLTILHYSVQRKWLLLFFFLHSLHFKTKHLSPSQHYLLFGEMVDSRFETESEYEISLDCLVIPESKEMLKNDRAMSE